MGAYGSSRAAVLLAIMLLGALAGSAIPARALDCATAKTPVETALCSSPALRKADAALGDLYFSTLAKLNGAEHDLLVGTQRQWLSEREGSCSEGKEDCIARAIAERHDTIAVCFAGQAGASAERVTSCPYFFHSGCPTLQADGSPGLKAYPFLVDRLVDGVKAMRTEFDCTPQADGDDMTRNSETDSYDIVTERPGLVCVKITQEGDFAGAAHPNSAEGMACYDTGTGAPLEFATLFPTLTADSEGLGRIRSLVDGHLTLDCCDPDLTTEGTFDELNSSEILPSGWAVTDTGDLLLAFEYNAYARVFLATATVPRGQFIDDVLPIYRAFFAPKPR